MRVKHFTNLVGIHEMMCSEWSFCFSEWHCTVHNAVLQIDTDRKWARDAASKQVRETLSHNAADMLVQRVFVAAFPLESAHEGHLTGDVSYQISQQSQLLWIISTLWTFSCVWHLVHRRRYVCLSLFIHTSLFCMHCKILSIWYLD